MNMKVFAIIGQYAHYFMKTGTFKKITVILELLIFCTVLQILHWSNILSFPNLPDLPSSFCILRRSAFLFDAIPLLLLSLLSTINTMVSTRARKRTSNDAEESPPKKKSHGRGFQKCSMTSCPGMPTKGSYGHKCGQCSILVHKICLFKAGIEAEDEDKILSHQCTAEKILGGSSTPAKSPSKKLTHRSDP